MHAFDQREEENQHTPFHNSVFLQQVIIMSQNPMCTYIYHKQDIEFSTLLIFHFRCVNAISKVVAWGLLLFDMLVDAGMVI
mgnify:CR=1 FL=1